jgi:hypothetical protein
MLEALDVFKKYHFVYKEGEKVFHQKSERIINGETYGKPLYFTNYNAKKPFLKHKTMPTKEFICTYEEALLRKQFYEWLWQFPKKQIIYLYHDGTYSLDYRIDNKPCIYIVPDKNFKGRLEIIDYDVLP